MGLRVFDAYEFRARVLPAIIIALPVGITLWCAFSWKDMTLGGTTVTGIVFLACVYAASMLVRAKGRQLEAHLIEEWGALPSTIIMRWRDDHLGGDLKLKYQEAVRTVLKLPMSTAEEEIADPVVADVRIKQAFDQVRGLLRSKDPKGLWFVNNCDYGFQRNLMGSRNIWLVVTSVSLLVTGILASIGQWSLMIAGFVVNFFMLIAAVYFGWSILPNGVEFGAFRYAESAWEAFLNIATRTDAS